MSWRTVVIDQRAKLDLSMGYMVVRGQDTKRIFLDEIAILIIENCAVSFTGCLVSELIRKKIKVIFCDEKRNPCAELMPTAGSFDCSLKIKEQIGWTAESKGLIWKEIIMIKILQQAELLEKYDRHDAAEKLRKYTREIEFDDRTNREGHAAKVYFNALFGLDFTRSAECPTNAALNYGYGLILSAFNREVSAAGYLTQLGLHHDNRFNAFNFSCDLMEPFRTYVDRIVAGNVFEAFDTEEKHLLIPVLNEQIRIRNTTQTLLNAIRIYTRSVFDAIAEADASRISFPAL